MSTVKRQSGGNLRRRGWDLLNVHIEKQISRKILILTHTSIVVVFVL